MTARGLICVPWKVLFNILSVQGLWWQSGLNCATIHSDVWVVIWLEVNGCLSGILTSLPLGDNLPLKSNTQLTESLASWIGTYVHG